MTSKKPAKKAAKKVVKRTNPLTENLNMPALAEIHDWLKAKKFQCRDGIVGFNMESFTDEPVNMCGTTVCIAGSAVYFNAANPNRIGNMPDYAQKVLGLNDEQAEALFYPRRSDRQGIDRFWAARTIDHLMRTGRVDWDSNKSMYTRSR